jgi:thiamine-monophosphate kinase
MEGKHLSELGEFGLIRRLSELVQAKAGPELEVAIGDDCAAWRTADGGFTLATTDALVEGVHFDPATTGWRDLGWKALAVNVSDIAAMGGRPRYALVTLGLRRDQPVAELEALYEGMQEHCQAYGLAVVGGDVVSSPTTFMNVTLFGESPGPLLRRSAGRSGDVLAVTGWLGSSAGGLRALMDAKERAGAHLSSAVEPTEASNLTRAANLTGVAVRILVEAHLRPSPRVREGQALVSLGVTCGMDLSDGLLGDATHICEESGLGARLYLEALPVHPALQRVFPEACRRMALAGGEDYELLCAVAPDRLQAVQRELEERTGTRLTAVGELEPWREGRPRVRVLDAAGCEVKPEGWSWEHFR